VARLCSSASQLLLRSLTSHVCSSSATAPHLPDAGRSGAPRLARRGISRFPSKELLHMPGSSTTPGRSDLAMVRPKRVAFRARNSVGARRLAFAAQWLAYALPCRRFAGVLTDANARLGADVDRSGRTEARTGLRMMPTSPRSPLSFRTAGFPRYGWEAGPFHRAFPIHLRP